VGQTLAVLGLMAAVLGAALRWDLPTPPPAPVVPAVRTKPRVTNPIQVRKVVSTQDNSNSSYAALGMRATPLPGWAPEWSRRAVSTVERVNRSFMSSLKELARKSILGRVT